MPQRIEIGNDEWNFTFAKGEREYRIDSLVYTSILLDKTKGDENPPKDAVIEAMKAAMDNHEGLSDHEIWALSVRLSRLMNKAGNA